jgi:site-specific recombinase XerD
MPGELKEQSLMESDRTDLVISEEYCVATKVPAIIATAGTAAQFAWDEFFAGTIRNTHTRKAYLFAVQRFLSWCEPRTRDLKRIVPGMVGRYFDEHPGSIPTKKLHMAAIRGFFDVLVHRHAIVLNPALSVRTGRYSANEGQTPTITVAQSKRLLESIKPHSVIDCRDRAIIGTLIYTAVRAGAVARLTVGDLLDEGTQFSLRFAEKNGKRRTIPLRHDLQQFLQSYLNEACIHMAAKDAPLFRAARGKSGKLSERPLLALDVYRMLKRRLKAAALPTNISPHSFRSCAATDLLLQGVPLDDVQHLLGHSDARTTRLYDRRQKQVTRNIVERISV